MVTKQKLELIAKFTKKELVTRRAKDYEVQIE
jgi:hypothetical protein